MNLFIKLMIKSAKLLYVINLIVSGCFLFSEKYSEDDIYVDRLVYSKKDSTLFTGTLKVVGKSSYYYESFCKGIPCGEWAEHQKGGGIIHKGKYLDENILSEKTRSLIKTDIFLIDHWQEGELPTITYPPYLTIFILKDNTFFETDMKQYDSYIKQLAQSVLNDTRSLKYDYLKISFGNAVYDGNKHYSKEYKLEAGKW
jgi:hypothetical protein